MDVPPFEVGPERVRSLVGLAERSRCCQAGHPAVRPEREACKCERDVQGLPVHFVAMAVASEPCWVHRGVKNRDNGTPVVAAGLRLADRLVEALPLRTLRGPIRDTRLFE